MSIASVPSVRLRCGRVVPAEQVAARVVAMGLEVDPGGAVEVADAPPWGSATGTVQVAIVDSEVEALDAVRSGANDALVWPTDATRLERSIEAARHRVVDAEGHYVYREVFRRLPTWVELTTPGPVLVDVSSGFEGVTGYARSEVVGRTPAELFRGGTHGAAFYDGIGAALAAGKAWHGDMLGRRRDGSLAVLEGLVDCVRRNGREIAHFAVKRQPSAVAPGSLGGWVQSGVSAPWMLVRRDSGVVVEVGPGAAEVFGTSREVLVESSFDSLGLDVSVPAAGEVVSEDRWVGQRAYELTATGRLVGDVEMFLVVLHDVTERLLREEDLDALAHDLAMARDQAMAADQAKSAFLAGMSHELRTPLNAILGYADLLTDEVDDAAILSDLAKIRTSGIHLLGLVDEVLDLARVESGEVLLSMEAFPVTPILQEVVDSVRMRAAAAGHELVLRVAAPTPMAFGDPQRVLQVLLNLVVNAIKYADPGQIVVGQEPSADGSTVLYVRDQGPGLTPHQQDRIFHSFRQLHATGDGVGLGLAISRRLAEAMGGRLEVTSTPGQGSRFCLCLQSTAEPSCQGGPASVQER